MEGEETHNVYDQSVGEEEYVEDLLDYNRKVIINPTPHKLTDNIINKDNRIGYFDTISEYEQVVHYTEMGAYLNQFKANVPTKQLLKLVSGDELLINDVTQCWLSILRKAGLSLKDVKSHEYLYGDMNIFEKSVHTYLVKSKVRNVQSGSKRGFVLKIGRTQYHKQERTLKDMTERPSFLGFGKRKSSEYSGYEKQKGWNQ